MKCNVTELYLLKDHSRWFMRIDLGKEKQTQRLVGRHFHGPGGRRGGLVRVGVVRVKAEMRLKLGHLK